MTTPGEGRDWMIRLLRETPYPEELTLDEMKARYRAAVRRYETDPEYRDRIRQLIAETDAQIAAEPVVKPLRWEIVTDACPAVNPETGGFCSRRGRGELGPHEGVHWHNTWEYDSGTGEKEISGWTEWEDTGSPS